MYIVINEIIVVDIKATDGVQPFTVLNGAWGGVADFEAGVFCTERGPGHKIKIETFREAVKGEMPPYY